MSHKLLNHLVVRTEVSLEDIPVSGACAHDGAIPSHGPHSTQVPSKRPYLLAMIGVPDLSLARVCSHRKVSASEAPAHRSD